MHSESEFDDIRPYTDEEVPGALRKLVDDEEFLLAIKAVRFPWLPNILFPVARPLIRHRIRQSTKNLTTVKDFQLIIERYIDHNIETTSDGLDIQGQEGLDPEKSYLFISNHRDIVMDPAYCNIAVHRAKRDTCRVAIGDNLLTKTFVELLMRVNKSFLVKRATGGGRELLRELKRLSSYIRKSVREDNETVWLAQREGRAKDGVDASDPALIKMLALSKAKGQSFNEAIRELNILPLAVSYEWDPCDTAKARELAARSDSGEYEKAEHEDFESIAAGIQGYKGHISLNFGRLLVGEYLTPEEVAETIDEQIIRMYRIHPSNIAAYAHSVGAVPYELLSQYDEQDIARASAILKERSEGLNAKEVKFLYEAYANPVVSRLNLVDRSALAQTAEQSISTDQE